MTADSDRILREPCRASVRGRRILSDDWQKLMIKVDEAQKPLLLGCHVLVEQPAATVVNFVAKKSTKHT
jgi:hypothetical protein